jgi:sulfate adenylyltransferase subunit 2
VPEREEALRFVAAARAAGAPVNIVDQTDLCDVQFGTIVNRAPVVIAISNRRRSADARPVDPRAHRERASARTFRLGQGCARMASAPQGDARTFRDRRAFWKRFVERAWASPDRAPTLRDRDELLNAVEPGRKGSVVLVGAGPGDPELLTLKAVRALQSATVILYDDLVGPVILELARREARRIAVGKTGHGPSCSQKEINARIVELALAGETVVRLKGGDPLIFGRATEEIEACEAAGLTVSIVPGISAAQGAAASLGFSLTERREARRVQFVTGHGPMASSPGTSTGTRSPIRSRRRSSTCRARRFASSPSARLRRHRSRNPGAGHRICHARRRSACERNHLDHRRPRRGASRRSAGHHRHRPGRARPRRRPCPNEARSMNAPATFTRSLTHLEQLEAESIHIMREVVAETERPVMLYSVGKDSAVMLHLARKAFYPAPPPFPLLHVDTTWKFRDMYKLRDQVARESGMELLVYQNPEAKERGINPFDHGSHPHRHVEDRRAEAGAGEIRLRRGLRRAPARRGEEPRQGADLQLPLGSHRWDPKYQRPELWNLYNARKAPGESIRVFPISNWTELDIWQYIYAEDIPIVPLYLAAPRPTVERDGLLLMVDDERFPLREGEVPVDRSIRFRTLGCYPLTGAVESDATTLAEVIQEMLVATTSERQGRAIDRDAGGASMEKKKQEGYF